MNLNSIFINPFHPNYASGLVEFKSGFGPSGVSEECCPPCFVLASCSVVSTCLVCSVATPRFHLFGQCLSSRAPSHRASPSPSQDHACKALPSDRCHTEKLLGCSAKEWQGGDALQPFIFTLKYVISMFVFKYPLP